MIVLKVIRVPTCVPREKASKRECDGGSVGSVSPHVKVEVFSKIILAFLLPAKGASKPTQPQVLTILTVV